MVAVLYQDASHDAYTIPCMLLNTCIFASICCCSQWKHIALCALIRVTLAKSCYRLNRHWCPTLSRFLEISWKNETTNCYCVACFFSKVLYQLYFTAFTKHSTETSQHVITVCIKKPSLLIKKEH